MMKYKMPKCFAKIVTSNRRYSRYENNIVYITHFPESKIFVKIFTLVPLHFSLFYDRCVSRNQIHTYKNIILHGAFKKSGEPDRNFLSIVTRKASAKRKTRIRRQRKHVCELLVHPLEIGLVKRKP